MKKLLLIIGGGFLLIIFLGLIGKNAPSEQPKSQTEVKEQKETKLAFVFDVPSLVGKNVDEIKKDLNSYKKKPLEPTSDQIKLGVKEWEVEFEKDGKSLLVTYDIATKRIKDFFISSDDPSGKTKDKSHLLELGNLKENDSRYKIEFVKTLKDPSSFTGVKIIPTLKFEYEILSRVEGKTDETISILIKVREANPQGIASEIQKSCKKQCNITLFDDKKAFELDVEYTNKMMSYDVTVAEREAWKKKNTVFLADHLVATVGYSFGPYAEYPLKDSYYRELKGEK
jgi:hypothetical protein